MTPFQGLIAFPITPMDADGRVDCMALRRLVRRIVEAEADGIGVLGSTGSYPYLTRDERRRAIEATIAEADGRTPVLWLASAPCAPMRPSYWRRMLGLAGLWAVCWPRCPIRR